MNSISMEKKNLPWNISSPFSRKILMPGAASKNSTRWPWTRRRSPWDCGVELAVDFWTPLLLEDLDILSRPCSYVDMAVRSMDGKSHMVEVVLEFDGELCCDKGQTGKKCMASVPVKQSLPDQRLK